MTQAGVVSAGARFRAALGRERPLQIVGAVNAYHAKLAEASGYLALYVSGGGVAAGSCGLPDLGITTLEDVLIDVRRITEASCLPTLVDIDTGWGGAFNIARAIRALIKAGAAAAHIEDQVRQKRCGHRPNKAIVPRAEMVDRIKAAVDARTDPDFVIMARTDALAVEGLAAAIDRAAACVEAGADMIFPEAVTRLDEYQQFAEAVKTAELASAGVSMALYPLSAFRAMNAAALKVYQSLRAEGTQRQVIDLMQTRAELYDYLGYHQYEQKLDELFRDSLTQAEPPLAEKDHERQDAG